MKNSAPNAAELKLFRLANGLTQVQAADLCRVSVRTYEKWEQDRQISEGYFELLGLKLAKREGIVYKRVEN